MGFGEIITGAGLGMFTADVNRKRNMQDNIKLMNQQLANSQQMSVFNRKQQMQLWKDTNYDAQLDRDWETFLVLLLL